MQFENQVMVENFFNKRQTSDLLRHELLSSTSAMQAIQKTSISEEFALDLMAQMILYKRATVPTLVGLLRKHFKDCGNPFQACADDLMLAVEGDLVDYDVKTDQFVVRFDVDQATHDLLRQYQYLPPMTVPPLKVTSNRGSGYITIKTDSLILQNNHHNGDLCLDSINRFNNVALSINTDVVKTIRNTRKNLDKAKPHETFEEYRERVKAFERYEKDSFFTIALVVEMGNHFYLTHKNDKRGRTYAQGYHINPQGNCWNKAVLEFADKEVVNGKSI